MSEIPERIWAHKSLELSTDPAVRGYWSDFWCWSNQQCYVRADLYDAATAERDAALARAERLEKALQQAIDAGSLAILTISDDEKGYGLWKYRGETIIVGQSSTENFFGGHLEECPELAAYLRAKEVE